MGTTLCSLLCLVGLLGLHPTKWAFSSWVASSCTLGTWNELLSASWLDITSCWKPISKPCWIEPTCCVMHLIFVSSEILPSAHELVSSCALSILSALNPLFINHSHLVEVVLCKIKMFSCLWLHFFSIVEVCRQLLNLETVFIYCFVCHAAILGFLILLMVIIEWDLWVTLIRRHLGAVDRLLVSRHVQSVDVLRVIVWLCPLSWMDYTLCLNFCFLPRRRPSWSDTLAISYRTYRFISSLSIIRVRIEVISCSGERRQRSLPWIISFEWLIDIWKPSLSSSYSTHRLNFSDILANWFLLLLDMRTVTAPLWSLLNFVVLIAKSVFWAILFLRGKYSLIEKLCVLASVECIVLKVLGSFSFWLLDDGFKFLLFIYSLVIIVIFSA